MNHEDNFVLLSAFESLWFKFKPDSYWATHYRLVDRHMNITVWAYFCGYE